MSLVAILIFVTIVLLIAISLCQKRLLGTLLCRRNARSIKFKEVLEGVDFALIIAVVVIFFVGEPFCLFSSFFSASLFISTFFVVVGLLLLLESNACAKEFDKQSICQEENCIDNVRVGYEVAASLASSGSEAAWTQINTFWVANSLYILAIATISTVNDSPYLRVLIFHLSILGLATCAIWSLIINRHFTYSAYWMVSARELEHYLAKSGVQTLKRGEHLAKGEIVKADGDKFKLASAHAKNEYMVLGTIYILYLAYLSIIIFDYILPARL
jgi:hypothetical protein